MAAHALLSPSSASIWLACTPSARLASTFPDTSGVEADEGTLAHSLGELMLRKRLGLIDDVLYAQDLRKIQVDELYEAAMFDHCDDYAVFVLEQLSKAQVEYPNAFLKLEHLLDLSEYVPEGFGTGDAGIIGKTMYVTDFKYGKGVSVSAIENDQLKLYALGWVLEYAWLYDIQRIVMTIYQPRLENVSTYELSVDELLAWAQNEVSIKALMAFNGQGEFNPGVHCRFCKAAGACKANADYNLELARHSFRDAFLMDDEEIADVLKREPMFTSWLNAVTSYAFTAALNGKTWPGFKLVQGRSNRVYTSEKKVADALEFEGFDEEKIYTKKLLGITAVEKLLGKRFDKLLGKFIAKPPGKPTLVTVDDKRDELNSTETARKAFAHLLTD